MPAVIPDAASCTSRAIDTARFSSWMAGHLGIYGAALDHRLGGGNSNVTQLVNSNSGRVVIRRPPDNAISASAANGVRREYRVLKSLPAAASVPAVLGFCEDPSILGQPFLVMEYIDGVAISNELPAAYGRDAATLLSIGEELVDAIATIHRIDWRSTGIAATAPHDYVGRQLERWLKVRAHESARDLPMLEEIGAWLLARRPVAARAAIIHGDFHLDNAMFRHDAPRLAAVIDWELATVGDPLADVALMLMFWGPRAIERPGFAFVQKVSRDGAAPSRIALAERWSASTGIPVDNLDYYLAFAFWRLAAIVEGAYVLYRKGLVSDAYSRGLEQDVPALLLEAAIVAGLR